MVVEVAVVAAVEAEVAVVVAVGSCVMEGAKKSAPFVHLRGPEGLVQGPSRAPFVQPSLPSPLIAPPLAKAQALRA